MEMTKRMEEIIQLGLDLGLDPFPVVYEVVDLQTMNNLCAYGLPTRARHWSYGRSYDHQKTYGEMGFSKVYEIILNNNPSYAFMLDTNTEVQNLFITAHCSGHCFAPGTLIETSDGPKKIEDIKPEEDYVLTHAGVYRNPIAISRTKYNGKLIKIRIGSNSICCTPEHPFLVVKHSKCSIKYRKSVCKSNCKYKKQSLCDKVYGNYKTEWVMANDLKKNDFVVYPKSKLIGSEKKINSFEITGEKGKGHPGGVKSVKYKINVDENFGEFLGLYLAEGYARAGGQIGLCYHTKEKELHNKSIKLVNQIFGLKCYKAISEKTHSHQVLFNEMVLANWLLENVGKGCKNKHIPNHIIKMANERFIKGFLRGIFSGDGHKSARSLALTTTSKTLASQVRQLCAKLDLKTNIKIKPHDNKLTAYDVIISGTSARNFLTYTGINWPDDPKNRFYEYCWSDNDNIYTPISDISKYYDETYVYNLEVPEDSSYTLFAGAVTHNSDFFKHNYMFKNTNRNMIRHAAEHAGRIEEYIEKYGFEAVERIMDIGFALDGHIDWHKGQFRKQYPKKKIVYKKKSIGEYDDLMNKYPKPTLVKEVLNDKIPPNIEKDLLWFFINYAPLEEWEKDVLDIMREEAFYFYPQMQTKILNEGWASYWHAEIMCKYDGLSPSEYLDFCRDHEKVVQPGSNPFRINPYYLGFMILKDVEKRWDLKYKNGESPITGRQKIFEIRENENDISFIRNYLTPELVEEMKLFTYGYTEDLFGNVNYIEIKERIRDEVVEALVSPLYNGGAPRIVITGTGSEGTLLMRHDSENISTLDFQFAAKTLEYVWELWAAPVELIAKNDDGEDVKLCFDEAGFYVINPSVVNTDDKSDFLTYI